MGFPVRITFKHLIIKYASYLLSSSGPARLFRAMTAGDGVIFTLHRVLPASDRMFQPNKLLEITPEFLRETVGQVRDAGYEFVSLEEGLRRLELPRAERNKFAVLTFDDGYKDNRDVAYPILKELNVPFTVFVTSEYSNHNSELWWVILERLIADNDSLTIRHRSTSLVYPCATLEEKNEAFGAARDALICRLTEEEQRSAIRDAAECYGLDWRALCKDLILSFEDLREFNQDPLVTLGAHTDTHPMLARLSSAEDMRQHIQSGLDEMKDRLGLEPVVLAYPYGFPAAVDERCEAVAEEMGFVAAVTTQPGTLRAGSLKRRFHLPRVSLNGMHQNQRMVDVYLTGAAFVAYHAARRIRNALRGVMKQKA
ncbi:Polysaccharide deacetylase [Pseudovibrio sp. Tun.PSC04-5.I4]|nr:Polysaccharide deacetylase [Pseudovibrio sp. Tun.PSC04-5.I4]